LRRLSESPDLQKSRHEGSTLVAQLRTDETTIPQTQSVSSPLPTQSYRQQATLWPAEGHPVLAHFDAESIIVYQACKPAIADHACTDGRLGGPAFSFSRMSWIKPNFLRDDVSLRLGLQGRPGTRPGLAPSASLFRQLAP